jgi:hypothetical protein
MTRRPRNYIPHLTAEYARQFPSRPPKTEFDDQILVAVAFIMRQLDPTGRKAVIEPLMPAEGYEPQNSVMPTGKRGRAEE